MITGDFTDPVAGPSLDVFNRVRLEISYDGTDFSGWAVQPGRRTVQDELQSALSAILRTDIALTVAGRTDAGVHATGQVAHFDVAADSWTEVSDSLIRRLAGVLPPDVRVRAAALAPAEFDARFGALWRRYEYRISDVTSGVDPLRRTFVLDHRRTLDADAMNEAAAQLVGLNDFVAFCKRREEASTIRQVQSFTVEREAGEIVVRIQADAFCHTMVRSLVGALIAVGEGRRPVDWPASLLHNSERANDVMVAGPHGLTLVEVGYPPDGELKARTVETRARRD